MESTIIKKKKIELTPADKVVGGVVASGLAYAAAVMVAPKVIAGISIASAAALGGTYAYYRLRNKS